MVDRGDRKIYVYDVETMQSCFTYTALNIDTEEIVQFVLHKDRFELRELIIHLKSCKAQIGFNNLAFDYPVIHYIMEINNTELITNSSVPNYISLIYQKAQELIEEQNKDHRDTPYKWNGIREKDFICPQLDLFKLWHYNNKARSTSLKALEISMNYPNVLESSIPHTKEDITLEEVQEILDYNLNDVLATFEFYKRSEDKINLRKALNQQYNLNCSNFSDSKIGEQLMLKLYCEETGKDIWETKKLRTNRSKIHLEGCILPYIGFKVLEFQKILEFFKGAVIASTKDSLNKSIIYKGFKYDFGLGGIHGCIKPGVYEADEEYMIIDSDVASLYPSIAINNNFYPEHLGKAFVKVYKSILDKRVQAKKEKNNTLSDGFKLALNSVYGKSNDENSFLYDPLYTMKTTINGQLLLSMLAESIVQSLECTVLQINTDGITTKIRREDLGRYQKLCANWEKITSLSLEHINYERMVIGDVNNYLSITTDGKLKNKGRFEVQKVVGSEIAYHKDNSFKIIPLAIQEYFMNGIPVEDTISTHTNIYDFCGRAKFRGQDYGETCILDYKDDLPFNRIERQQKNTRYYISNKGSTFYKRYAKGSSEVINKGYEVQIFNKYIEKPMKEYNINYQFYIKACNQEINNIVKKQLTLF